VILILLREFMAISRFVFLESFGLAAEMLTTRPSGIIIDVKNPSGRRPTQSDMSDCDHQ